MPYLVLILTTMIFTSCSYSSYNSEASSSLPMTIETGSSTTQKQDPYTIGSVDTAFKLI